MRLILSYIQNVGCGDRLPAFLEQISEGHLSTGALRVYLLAETAEPLELEPDDCKLSAL